MILQQYVGSSAWKEHVIAWRLCDFFVLPARNFEFTKHLGSRFWLPLTAVWRARRPHTPHQRGASASRATYSWLSGAVAVRKWSANVHLGAVFWLLYIKSTPKFDRFRPISTTAASHGRRADPPLESGLTAKQNRKLLRRTPSWYEYTRSLRRHEAAGRLNEACQNSGACQK